MALVFPDGRETHKLGMATLGKEPIIEYMFLVGKTGTIEQGGLVIQVKISDVREMWGRLQALVSPVSGSGSVWVMVDRIKIGG